MTAGRSHLVTFALAALALAILAPPAMAQTEPAGGAEIEQVIIATAGAVALTAALLFLGIGHRRGSVTILARAQELAERATGVAGWATLPALISTLSLVTAVFGMYWDISLHIDVGRDAGPLANPAHYFILAGLFGIFSAGFVAMVLPMERPSATAVRITRNWYAPLGGVLICACGAFSLLGFPLDDFWHRLFGQDVTLWGPTHLMLIGGAAMTLVGMAVLLVEGLRASGDGDQHQADAGWAFQARRIALTGGFLIGLSTFQAEFDFGVPQYRFVLEPMMVMLAAGIALVATRIWVGRGAALGAVGFFIAIRGGLALLVGPVLGESTPHFPLYLAEAGLVELVALLVSTKRPLLFGAVSGVLIGTVGLAAEWGWSHVWMPIPWPSTLLPEGALLGFAAAVAGSLLGAWVGARLSAERIPRTRGLRVAALLGAAASAAMVGYGLYKPADEQLSAEVVLDTVEGGADRTVDATVTFDSAEAPAQAEWLTVTSWQGGGLVVDHLEQVGDPATYRTTQPVPVHGTWKTMVRLHEGNSLMSMPIFLPEDPAIPAPEVPAEPRFERELVADKEVLQREATVGDPIVTVAAYGVVVATALALLVLLVWGLHQLAKAAGAPVPRPPAAAEPRQRTAARRGGGSPRPPTGEGAPA
jgi:hypothetical protein